MPSKQNQRITKSIRFQVPVFQILVFILLPLHVFGQDLQESCTIGVAAAAATADGRPLIWKSRDAGSTYHQVLYDTTDRYEFIAVVNAGTGVVSMGVNEKGFAIVNAEAPDLPNGEAGPGNLATLRQALGTCTTVVDFEQLLDSTNTTGRQTHANMAVLDASGAAVMFEIGGSMYWKFDANDSTVAPEGYILRTNFAWNGDGTGGGYERYNRQRDLVSEFHSGDSLNYRSLARHQLRDFSDLLSRPIPVPFPQQWAPEIPFGYVYTNVSICRYWTVSAVVIQGVIPGEPPELSTMWTLLGHPATAITIPYWPIGQAPPEAGDLIAPLCDTANKIKGLLFNDDRYIDYIDSYKLLDGQGGGLWTHTFPAEDSIFSAAETLLTDWRSDTLDTNEMLATEGTFARYALSVLDEAYEELATLKLPTSKETIYAGIVLEKNYPNPFNATTTIRYHVPQPTEVTLIAYDVLGREVARLVNSYTEPGYHQAVWNGRDPGGRELPSGVYIARLVTPEYSRSIKMVLLK
ncbi:MAG: T9SS type A sorting domain-containing protein [Fidelibacterota bacterium]|nr:MAG: T9SS type A sorting domain-containing protein [Candidatus Neomarinimicrobiota bacterium]